MEYLDTYAHEIFTGLNNVMFTDQYNNRLECKNVYKILADKMESIKRNNGLVFFSGNGASATMAEHMSNDFFQNGLINTQTCSETSYLTAIGNDIGFEKIFSYKIGRIVTHKDLLITISSSGNSSNIINAQKIAKKNGCFVATLSGKDEYNLSRNEGNINIYVPLETYGLVESAHAIVLHSILDFYMDRYMEGRH